MNSSVKIGVSLSPFYLNRSDDPNQQWLGPADAFLRELSEAGATHIELRAISPGTPIEPAETALRQVWEAGLEATLHGSLPVGDDNGSQTLTPLAHLLKLIQNEHPNAVCPITMHARSAASGDLRPLADETVASLSRTARWMKEEGLPARVAVEINRAKNKADPATTYRGVIDIQQRANAPKHPVGITWDMGHTYSNILTDQLPPMPPSEFLDAVIHTHIHDLGPTHVTHWPLTEGRMPLERFVRALAGAGYDGVWNLELEPRRYPTEARIRERVIESIGLLRSAVQSASAQPTTPV